MKKIISIMLCAIMMAPSAMAFADSEAENTVSDLAASAVETMYYTGDSTVLRAALMDGYMDAMQTAVYALAVVGGVCALRKKGGAALLMIPVTVLGGALYHLIFEAKAQYAYPYMVYMLPLAAAGLCRLEDGAARLICSGKKWVQRRAECARTSHRD